MGQTKSAEQEKAEFLRAAEAMYEELHAWRDKHLDASFDEIADQVAPQRRKLVAKLLEQLAIKADERVEAPQCEQCGEKMRYRGTPERDVSHREGDVEVERAYYYCDSCERGLFPPRPSTKVE
jgi:methionyl-tRNA synthetase